MPEEYKDFDESQKFNKWWNPLSWSPWIRYSLLIWFVAMFAWNSTSPSSVIITALIIWLIVMAPNFLNKHLSSAKETFNIKSKIESDRKKSEESNLTVREEQIFKQLTDDLFDK